MRYRILALLPLGLAVGALAACGGDTALPHADARGIDGGLPPDGAPRPDSSADSSGDSPAPSTDSSTDSSLARDGTVPAADASTTCPVSCPAGQVVVSWDDSAPGFPGPVGCACKVDPCPDAGTGCDCASACEQLGHGACCSWQGATLSCNECG